MPKTIDVKTRGLERVIDANFNRAKEGLRVCEDTARFIFDDRSLAAGYKAVRHQLTQAVQSLALKNIILARDVAGDVGRPTTVSESRRESIHDVFYANTQRVKESLRVLEEFAKLVNVSSAESFKALRYKVYEFEKKAFGRL
jgi:thiamine-phosphate pyrophosphorylase